MKRRALLGGYVQKAKRAEEKREKGWKGGSGDEGLNIPQTSILPPLQTFLHRLPNTDGATGDSPAGVQGPSVLSLPGSQTYSTVW